MIQFICQSVFAAHIVKFKATDSATDKPVKIDSVLVKNVTLNVSKMITADSVDLDLITSTEDSLFNISQPQNSVITKPNPFASSAEFQIYKDLSSEVKLQLFDILGNILFTKTIFLENGVHNFIIEGTLLNQGYYYLSVTDKGKRYFTNFLKTEGSLNSVLLNVKKNYENIISYYGKTDGVIVYNKNNIIYSFTCFAKNYHSLNSGEKNIDEFTSLDSLNFVLTTNKKFNISGGTIKIFGINCTYSHYYSRSAPPNEHETRTDSSKSTINFNYDLQNVALPKSPVYYANPYLGCRFLTNLDFSNDSMVVDFCELSFETNSYYNISTSKIVELYFNENSNKIDSLKIRFYIRNFHLQKEVTDDQVNEEIWSNIFLTNIPFSIDIDKNILVEINGKEIANFLKTNYQRNRDQGHGAYMTTERNALIRIDSISDDAYIKIILNP